MCKHTHTHTPISESEHSLKTYWCELEYIISLTKEEKTPFVKLALRRLLKYLKGKYLKAKFRQIITFIQILNGLKTKISIYYKIFMNYSNGKTKLFQNFMSRISPAIDVEIVFSFNGKTFFSNYCTPVLVMFLLLLRQNTWCPK